MYIQKEGSLFFIVANFLLQPEDFRVTFFARELPLSVDVSTRYIRSVVTTDNSVYVDHWNNSELILISQLLGLPAVGEQKIDESLNNVGSRGFAGVLPANYIDELFVRLFFVCEIGDVQDVDRIAH